MEHFAEDYKVVTLLAPVSLSSVQASDIINMSEYDKVSIVINIGAVSTGSGISFREMDSVSDTVSAEDRLNVPTHYKSGGAASDTFTLTSAASLSSAGGITVGASDDNTTYIAEIRGDSLTDGSNCIGVYVDSAGTVTMLTSITAYCHPRYKQANPPTALA